jgi:hypothetical protein
MASTTASKKVSSMEHTASESEDAFPDYNKRLKTDPELRAKVDAVIKAHTEPNEA